MRDTEIGRILARLESTETDPSDAAIRAKARMLDAFDSSEPIGMAALKLDAAVPASEITVLAHMDPSPRPKRTRRLWAAAAAAAVIALGGLAIRTDVTDRYDPSTVSAADSETEHRAEPKNNTLGAESETEPTFVDDDVPRLIDERFSTTALGGTLSFVPDEPIWLTQHTTELIELSGDPSDPMAAKMVIAYVDFPSLDLGSGSAIDYLASQPPGVTGQVTPYVLDGVQSRSWRGRIDPGLAGKPDCKAGEVCLTLFHVPIEVGIYPGVHNDVLEWPVTADETFVMTSAIPFNEYGIKPFAKTFENIVATITFEEEPIASGG